MSKEKANKQATADKRTIGVTSRNERSLANLVTAGHFGSELDAAKFAMAHAIRAGTPGGSTDGASTKWNVGTVDADGGLKALVETIYGEVAEPYRLIEHLINEGLGMLDTGDGIPPDVARMISNSRAKPAETTDGTVPAS